jgi:transcription elongation factor GreA
MKKQYQITIEGKKELELELASLKGHRIEIANKISEARDYGDLSENAEYEVAREEQGIVETRISEIEDILQNAEIIKSRSNSKVDLGNRVELKTQDSTVIYTVVGPVEADPLEGKISNKSPIGEALFGKKVGEKVEIKAPKGSTTYEITSIS